MRRIRASTPTGRIRSCTLAAGTLLLGTLLGVPLLAQPAEPTEATAAAEPTEPADATSAAQPVEEATRSIETLHEHLLDVMKNADTLGYEGRAEKLAAVVPRHYDVPFMAEKSVGRHWRSASEEERARFLDVFRRFMIANYAGQFDGYSGQSFVTRGQEPARLDTVLVKTRLVNPQDEDVELNYRMRQVDGTWKIIDVYLDGTVSELALRRSEFSGIARRDGMDALVAAIEERIADLAAGTAKR